MPRNRAGASVTGIIFCSEKNLFLAPELLNVFLSCRLLLIKSTVTFANCRYFGKTILQAYKGADPVMRFLVFGTVKVKKKKKEICQEEGQYQSGNQCGAVSGTGLSWT